MTSERPTSGNGDPVALTWRELWDPRVLLATGLGCGFAPVAPGTVGSVLGAVVWWFVFSDMDYYVRWAAAFAAFFFAVLVVDSAAKRYGLGDDRAIVLDEVVGMWFALVFMPKSIPWVVVAFLLFRIADIVKPWPASWVDTRVTGGLGIMGDDLIAGLMAAAVAFVAWYAMS